ncbi:MAG: peptide chain release factor 2 [Candidatus Kerfeldbacteria bacterium]|nr:peptide chain release factor 2 [Candidatus Kerfeldbacteria bacterium]
MDYKSYRKKCLHLGGYFDLDQKQQEVLELEERMAQPGFWNDRKKAEAESKHLSELKDDIAIWGQLKKQAADLVHVLEEPEAESLRKDIEHQLGELEDGMRKLEFRMLLSDKHDEKNAIVAVHAGTGGTDAQDWAEMLLRMILRFCEKQGWQTRLIDESRGQEAGVKSATVEVKGRFAYGYLKSEAGVHRLVRISPFDAEKMRHTSFALVEVIPEFAETEAVKIDPKDIRVDTFLSGGHGGQSVQTTYSAVRVVHLPTKIMVSVQNERSQQQNREMAMKILQAKLQMLEEEKLQKEKRQLRGEYAEAAWGNQIRSYVLQPYRMVKDHRTKEETGDVDAVLNGELQGFIEAYLRWVKEGRPKRGRGKDEE